MAQRTVLDNGQLRNTADLKITFLGVELTGVTALAINPVQEKSNVYSAGSNDPSARKNGNRDYSGTLTVMHRQYEAMQQASVAVGGILGIPMASLTYTFSRNGVVTDDVPYGESIKGVGFTGISASYEVDGDNFVELTFIASAVVPIFL